MSTPQNSNLSDTAKTSALLDPDDSVVVLLDHQANVSRRGAEERFRDWAEQFVAEASRAPGHEGGSVLSGRGGGPHLILLRFASAATLEAWQRSSGYEALMRDADAVSTAGDESQIQSGLETWFTLPEVPTPPKPPPKWKMAIVTWLALLPMVIALAFAFEPIDLPFLIEVSLSTALPVDADLGRHATSQPGVVSLAVRGVTGETRWLIASSRGDSVRSERRVRCEKCGRLPREGIMKLEKGPVPRVRYASSTAFGRFSASRYEFETGIISSWMPLTTSVGWGMPLRSPKRVPVDCSHSRNAAICAAMTSGPDGGVEILGLLYEPLDERTAGGLARRSGREEDLLQHGVPLRVGSPRCLARLGFSRCMMSSPPRGAVPTRIIRWMLEARSSVISCATIPPSENPSTSQPVTPKASRKAKACAAIPATVVGTLPVDRPIPALSNRMTSRPPPSGSVTAGSQLSYVPVKCCRQSRGRRGPPPIRRYAYVSSFTRGIRSGQSWWWLLFRSTFPDPPSVRTVLFAIGRFRLRRARRRLLPPMLIVIPAL